MILRLLKMLFGGCDHKWVIIDSTKVHDLDCGDRWTRYHLQCEKCGDVKVKDMR